MWRIFSEFMSKASNLEVLGMICMISTIVFVVYEMLRLILNFSTGRVVKKLK